MIYFFYGEDTYSAERELSLIKGKFLKTYPQGLFEELRISEESSDEKLGRQIQEFLQAQGLFESHKLITVRDFLKYVSLFPQPFEYLEKFIKNKQEDNLITLVFFETGFPDRRFKLFQTLKKFAKAKQFFIPRHQALEDWIKTRLAEEGAKINQEALQTFVGRVGEEYNLWQVENELQKLILFSFSSPGGDGKMITKKEVLEVVSPSFSQNIFALTNALGEGKMKEALTLLQEMVRGTATDQKTWLLKIIAVLANQIRSLLMIKDLAGMNPEEIAKILNWKEARVWVNLRLAKKFSSEKLQKLLRDLRAIDFRLKTSEEPVDLLLVLFFEKTNSGFVRPLAE